MARRLETILGSLTLKNPVIARAGEHLMTASGIRAAIDAGASVVVAKSFNETEAAKDQLDHTDYALIDSNFQRLPWDFAPPRDATLACWSGLTRVGFDEWLDVIVRLDREAAKSDCIVAANIILADLDAAVGFSLGSVFQ
jgi:dihydroorotate dehydrogenase (NAD+) catalytic subunit